MRGLFNLRPSLPRYSATWDVNTVLTYISSLKLVHTLSLKTLTLKLVTLLAILTGQRVQTLTIK